MNIYKRKKIFSAAYIRFHKQVVALHEGKLRTVKQLASEARRELIHKSYRHQLSLMAHVYGDMS